MSDPEMETWREAWSASDEMGAPSREIDITVAIRRHEIRSAISLAVNVVFGIVLIAGSLVLATRMHSREMIFWAAAVWMATLVALFLALESWQKERIRPTETVADYAEFHRLRSVADSWKARTAALLLVGLFCVSCTWLTVDFAFHRIGYERYIKAMAILVAISMVWSYGLLWIWGKATAILRNMPKDGSGDIEESKEDISH